MKGVGLKLILALAILVVAALAVSVSLIIFQRLGEEQPAQGITAPTQASLEGFSKIHIHELYKEYEENPKATVEKWRGKPVIILGMIWGGLRGNVLYIYSFPYIVTPIELSASCPIEDRKLLSELENIGKKGRNESRELFVALSGRIAAIELSTQYNHFEVKLESCRLHNVAEVREFKAQFFKENWSLVINNYGYSLGVWIRRVDEQPFGGPPTILNPLQREVRINLSDIIFSDFKRPGDYVLEVVNTGESTVEKVVVLANWTFRIPGLEAINVSIAPVEGLWLPNTDQYYLHKIEVRFYNNGTDPAIVFIDSREHVLQLAIITSAGERARCTLTLSSIYIYFVLMKGDEKTFEVYAPCKEPISRNVNGEEVELALIIKEGGRELEIARTEYTIPPRS
jgi:hypothetical protein